MLSFSARWTWRRGVKPRRRGRSSCVAPGSSVTGLLLAGLMDGWHVGQFMEHYQEVMDKR